MSEPNVERDAIQSKHYVQCLREVRFVTVAYILTAIYVSVMCATYGYLPETDRPDAPWLIWGIPGWVMVSVILPWVVVMGVIAYFAQFVLKDDEPLHESELADDVV